MKRVLVAVLPVFGLLLVSTAALRAEVKTMNHELLKVSTSVSAADLSIPAGFKEKK